MREVSARPNKWIPLCVAVCVIAVCAVMFLGNPRHKTSSGGDFNIPTFANGGTYRDGTRSMTFEKTNNLAYTTGSQAFPSWLIIPILAVAAQYFLGKKKSCSIPCNGSCCKI
jgi:hypothetical protein